MFEATKSWKGGFNMKKTYQEPVTEIVKLDIVDTTFATWAIWCTQRSELAEYWCWPQLKQ